MSRRSDTALIALRRILRVTEMNARELSRESGLTISQLLVLQHLLGAERSLASSIAVALGVSQATVTVLVNKLEAQGLVVRRRDSDDKRRVWIEPTARGRRKIATAPDLLQARFERSFAELANWEQAMIISALERVAALLDAREISASPVLDVGDLDQLP